MRTFTQQILTRECASKERPHPKIRIYTRRKDFAVYSTYFERSVMTSRRNEEEAMVCEADSTEVCVHNEGASPQNMAMQVGGQQNDTNQEAGMGWLQEWLARANFAAAEVVDARGVGDDDALEVQDSAQAVSSSTDVMWSSGWRCVEFNDDHVLLQSLHFPEGSFMENPVSSLELDAILGEDEDAMLNGFPSSPPSPPSPPPSSADADEYLGDDENTGDSMCVNNDNVDYMQDFSQ